jgi:hypothetical protein
MGVTWTRENTSDQVPTFESMESWQKAKSTKIDYLARICQHILKRDDMPAIQLKDGEVIFPPPPTTPHATQDVKIIIYMEFSVFIPLVESVRFKIPS